MLNPIHVFVHCVAAPAQRSGQSILSPPLCVATTPHAEPEESVLLLPPLLVCVFFETLRVVFGGGWYA